MYDRLVIRVRVASALKSLTSDSLGGVLFEIHG